MLKLLRQAFAAAAAATDPFGSCLVYGKDAYLHEQLARGLKTLGSQGHTLEIYDCAKLPFQDFIVTVAAPSLFASRKIVHLCNLDAYREADCRKLIAWIDEEAVGSSIGYLFLSSYKFVGNRFPVTTLKKKILTIKSDKPKKHEVVAFLRQRLARLEVRPVAGVLEQLVELHDANLSLLECEIEKLGLYVGPGGRLDKKVVERLGVDGGGSNIFKFCDALGERKVVVALQHLDALFRARTEPLLILAMVARQYRLICRAATLKKGKTSPEQLAKDLKVMPFVAGKLINQSRGVDAGVCAAAFAVIHEVDMGIKSSRLPLPVLFQEMVFKLTRIGRK